MLINNFNSQIQALLACFVRAKKLPLFDACDVARPSFGTKRAGDSFAFWRARFYALAWAAIIGNRNCLASNVDVVNIGLHLKKVFFTAKSPCTSPNFSKLHELQYRIRPHFLFNTLNSAVAMVRSNPKATERMLEYLSDSVSPCFK